MASHSEASHHIVPIPVYVGVFLALIAATIVTTLVAYIDLGPFNIVIALFVAVCKASLVVLFFMHVKYSPRLTKLVVICGIFWLIILLTMTESDLLTRTWMGVPGR
ncbi:MAG TPA: cytochrome C oxidase subunit IV family protein [Bryobacteraceae bacterium]|jgi:cytochrome c oxidase subunit 4